MLALLIASASSEFIPSPAFSNAPDQRPFEALGSRTLEPLRFTEHEMRSDGPGPALSPADAEHARRRLSTVGSLLGDLALTTVSGSLQCEAGQTQGCSKTLPVGENIFGPFEAGFSSQQDNVIQNGFGCSTPSSCYSDGGIDTELSEAMCAHACGITLPRVEGGKRYGFLDTCGGHTGDYHFHQKLECLGASAAPTGNGHSTKIAEGTNAAKTPLYGQWEDYSTSTKPLLDACGGHFGVTPDSGGASVYHNHVQDKPPFFFGCYGPNADNTMVTVEQCRAIYATLNVPNSGGKKACDGDLKSLTTSLGTFQYDEWCPCWDGATSGNGVAGRGSNTGVDIVQLPFRSQSGTAAAAALPNVLIFQPDDMYQGYSASAWHAPTDPGFNLPSAASSLTANIDKIGTEGAVFTAAYTASGMCAPSRLALMTGRYPTRGAYAISKDGTSAPPAVTVPRSKMTGNDLTHNLPRALKSVGYTTFASGKWHLAADEELVELGCSSLSNGQPGCSYAVQQAAVKAAGFDKAEAVYISNLNGCGSTCMSTYSHNLEWLTAEALTFMHGAIDEQKPFFAYVNPTPPHQGSPTDGDWIQNVLTDNSGSSGFGPYTCDKTSAGTIADAWTANCKTSLSATADFSAWCSGCTMKSREQLWADTSGVSNMRDRSKVAGLAWADQSLGVLYTYLGEKSALASTIIVVTSDNGEAKGSVYEYGVRTMLNVRYGAAGGIAAGKAISAKVSNLDLAPSIFGLIGLSGTYDTDGVSWAAVATGASDSLSRSHLIVEMANDFGIIDTVTSAKLVYQDQTNANNLMNTNARSNYPNWGTETQLYDLTVDDQEATNLASNGGDWTSKLASLNAARSSHVVYVTNKACCTVAMSLTASGVAAALPSPSSPTLPSSPPTAAPAIEPGAETTETTARYVTRVTLVAQGSVADFTAARTRQIRQAFATAASVSLAAVELDVSEAASSGRRLALEEYEPWPQAAAAGGSGARRRRLQSASSSVVLTATVESSTASARDAATSSLSTSLSSATAATTFLSAAGVTVTQVPTVESVDIAVVAADSASNLGLIIGLAVGVPTALLLVVVVWWLVRRQRVQNIGPKSGSVAA